MSNPVRTDLARRVDAARERLIATTQRLVAVASPNPPSDTHDVAQVAETLLREIPGIEVERIEPVPRVVSLIGRIKGKKPGRRLIFNGHLDTFPLLENLPWTVPPLASNFVQLIKFSSLGAVISVNEITRRGMELSATNFRPLETFTFIAVVYFLICWPLAMGIRFWERRLQNR